MKNSTNILIFFIAIFLLFWNPISFYIFYSKYEIYNSLSLKLLFWILPISSLLLIATLIKKNHILIKFHNVIFGFYFLGIFFSILIIINSLLGFFTSSRIKSTSNNSNNENGLIFEPNTSAIYKTVEFDFNSKISSIGLRNKEISIQKQEGTYRILCFGDSYTYGWGVNIDHSWPMQLEEYLRHQGLLNIEVINCGQPGQYTSTYKKYMAEIVPLLKPDLVLVGILQIDDLAQLFENHFILENDKINLNSNLLINDISNFKYLFKEFSKASFGNYITILKRAKNEDKIDVSRTWQESSNNQIEKFEKLQKLRFLTLPDTVKVLFKTGNINPGLLHYYINFPDRITIFNSPNHPATIFALDKMDKDINEMKSICQANEINMVFINMPTEYFCGHEVGLSQAEFPDSYFLDNNNIDSLYRDIANRNQIQYLQLTERFIELKGKETVFFLYDDHPNEKGYKEIAESVGEYLIRNNFKSE